LRPTQRGAQYQETCPQQSLLSHALSFSAITMGAYE
jgi:hypothetical protein